MRRRHRLPRETGAILPLFAFLIVVLMIFAAFTVDLGAAWAERRSAQTTADASVMAAALEYLRSDSPTEEETVGFVLEYANLNSDIPKADWMDLIPEWDACTDSLPSGFNALVADVDGSGDKTYECIALSNTAGEPILLRVRVPDVLVETSFARLINIDTIPVSAIAVAQIASTEGFAATMPLSLPANGADGEGECLLSPPAGLLPGEESPCPGAVNGNFGLFDGHFYGIAGEPHFTLPTSCTNSSEPIFKNRSPHNLAIGLDHPLVVWPDSGTLNDDGDPYLGNPPPGADNCDTALLADNATYAVQTQPGTNDLLHAGMLGDHPSTTAASSLGRLRQPSQTDPPYGVSDPRLTLTTFDVDNVGLWEYLDYAAIDPTSPCSSGSFSLLVGRALTEHLVNDCLPSGDALFIKELGLSPRFTVVPVLNYNREAQYGGKWWAVKELKATYLQSTWFHCQAANPKDCVFQPEGQAETSVLFNPGEGTASPLTASGGAPNLNKFMIQGMSGIPLNEDWLHPDTRSLLGNLVGLTVRLYE